MFPDVTGLLSQVPQGGMSAPAPPPKKKLDFGAIIQQLAPAIMAGIAAKQGGRPAAGAMLEGYTRQLTAARERQDQIDAQQRAEARDEQERQMIMVQQAQQRKEKAAAFLQGVAQDALKAPDEASLARYMDLAARIGREVYGLEEDEIRQVGGFNQAAADARATGEASTLIDTLQKKHGPQFRELVDSGATVRFRGKDTAIEDLLSLANVPMRTETRSTLMPLGMRGGMAPISAQRQTPILPEPVDDGGSSDFARYLKDVYAEATEKKGAALTSGERRSIALAARKEFNQVDDRALRGPDPALSEIRELTLANLRNQGMTPQAFTQANALRDDFRADSKDYTIREGQYRIIRDIADAEPSAAGDLSLIFAYMKMLDPGSVVREGEQASASNAAGVPDRIRNTYNRLLTGEKLNPNQRQDFKTQSARIYRGARQDHNRRIATYEKRARAAKVPVEMVIADPDPSMADDTAPQMVKMRAPDGSVKEVPADQVEHYKALGATVIR